MDLWDDNHIPFCVTDNKNKSTLLASVRGFFGTQSVDILVIPSPTTYMLTSFDFSL